MHTRNESPPQRSNTQKKNPSIIYERKKKSSPLLFLVLQGHEGVGSEPVAVEYGQAQIAAEERYHRPHDHPSIFGILQVEHAVPRDRPRDQAEDHADVVIPGNNSVSQLLFSAGNGLHVTRTVFETDLRGTAATIAGCSSTKKCIRLPRSHDNVGTRERENDKNTYDPPQNPPPEAPAARSPPRIYT